MRHRAFSIFPSLLLIATLAISACAASPQAPPDDSSHLLPHQILGNGVPLVVFDAGAGAGESFHTWSKVLPSISQFTRTYAYTRRGYSGVPVLSHRDGLTIVEELRSQLHALNLNPPYILVGHSLGGLYMQLFAKTHPDEVAGVVLVDTTHPDQLERMKTERPGNYRLVKSMMVLQGATTLGAEMRGTEETQKQWLAAGPLPPVPTILLSAQRDTAMNGHEFTAFFQQLHRELAAAWPGAELRMVDSDHFIQKHQPEAVVQAVRDVFDRSAHASAKPPG